ncbi:MAG TPA: RidA family protein [Ancylobacter sp.]
MTERRLISSGSPFEAVAGYSRAVVDGDFIFVSGTTGYDYAAMSLPEGVEEQAHGCFRNIAAALEQAGGSLADVVRVRYIITSPDYAEAVFPIFGQYFGEIRPAATLIVAGLLQPEMKIEIEVTARRRT